jgi:DNA-binding response OmpR family regulator
MVAQALARILVVDDDTASRLTLDVALFCQGYEVATAANGEEALAWLMREDFDLLLIDFTLPGIDGLEVARGAQRCQPSAMILFLTGSSDFNGAPIEEQIAGFDYMRKSASSADVLDRVTAVLGHRREIKRAA